MIWLRRHVMRALRRFMVPIQPDVARKWHNRLTFAYIFLSFNALLAAIHHVKTVNPDRKVITLGDKAHDFAKWMQLTNPTIIRVSPDGVKVEQYTVPHDYDNK